MEREEAIELLEQVIETAERNLMFMLAQFGSGCALSNDLEVIGKSASCVLEEFVKTEGH